MSENEDTPPASPSWMQSQTKPTESTPPKSRKPRRTKAQMVEARVLSVEVQPSGYAPAIDVPVSIAPLNYPHLTWWDRALRHPVLIQYIAILVSLLSLSISIATIITR